MDSLITRVERSIATHELLARGDSVLVGVSGGADSMVLLHVLHQLAVKHRWELIVAHFNHRLRGKDADADERFVARAAGRLGLGFKSASGDVSAFARERKISIEMAARTLRHEFLADAAKTFGARTIALAHHADDQAELFLLRLLRGASSRGLGGMDFATTSPSDPSLKLVRPLLNISKAELLAFARAHRVRFRDDATNASTDPLRNRIRHKLLPLLRRDFQPGVDAILLRTAELLRAESSWLDAEVRAWMKTRKPAFNHLPVALQRRVLHAELLSANIIPDFDLIERLRLRANDWTTTTDGVICRRDANGRVELRAPDTAFRDGSVEVNLREEVTAQFSSADFAWRAARGSKRSRPVAGREFFDADAVGERIILRHWRAGDRFQPIGFDKAIKLQDWFVNQKVPRDRRRELILATTAAGEIFWVEGLRIGDRFKIKRTTRRTLEWRWNRAESLVAAPKTGC